MVQPRQYQFWRHYYWKCDISIWSKLNNTPLPHALILFPQRSLTWWLNLVFTHLCIPIYTTKLYSQYLIYKYLTHHHTHEKSGTMNKQILNLSDGQLLILIGMEPFSILILMRKFLFPATLYWTYWATLFLMSQ